MELMQKSWLILLISVSIFLISATRLVKADELQDLENQFQDTKKQLQDALNQKEQAQKDLAATEQKIQATGRSLASIEQTLTNAKNQLAYVLVSLDTKQKELNATINYINIKEKELNHQRELLFAQIRSFYINSSVDPLVLFLQSQDFDNQTKLAVFRQAILGAAKAKIEDIGQKINELNDQKKSLQNQKNKLEEDRITLEKQKRDLEIQIVATQKDLAAAQSQQQNLMQSLAGVQEKISSLTAEQQKILAQKAAAALSTTTVGNEELTSLAIAGPAPPDGQLYFSFWTYGYPHRVGMNQYGAYGRAKAGQNFEQIIKAYYSGVTIGTYPEMSSITINDNSGGRSILFEDDYLMGIGEMPSCWGSPDKGGVEALKAQAIAARTYAIASTANGQGSICTDQRCQVYIGSAKTSGQCGEYWKKAVEETRGLVILYQGQPISAWYASTAGGFTLSSEEAWGTARDYAQGISDFSDPSDLSSAFDGPKNGNSPWYHKSWGGEPWLTAGEVTDLFNASLLSNDYNDKISPSEKGGFDSSEIVNTLKGKNITPVENLTSLEVIGSATKASQKIRAYFNQTFAEVDASRFKFVFNLRSPGTDAIWTGRFDVVSSK